MKQSVTDSAQGSTAQLAARPGSCWKFTLRARTAHGRLKSMAAHMA
jgi:hypothetical protein